MASPTLIAGYLALFVAVGFLFVLVNLMVGWLVRPSDPHEEKREIYECGEPTIGSSFVQFDLRFYVVALVFIVFDVEVAFLYPLATVYGKATNLSSVQTPITGEDGTLSTEAAGLYQELGVVDPALPAGRNAEVVVREGAREMAWATFAAINVFFVILLIGFAYEWKTGAFDWVRAVTREKSLEVRRGPPREPIAEEPVLTP